VKGRKRHILVDTEGWLIRVLCLPADIQDWDAAGDLFLVAKPACPRLALVWADGAYGRNEPPEWTAAACGWKLEVVGRPAGAKGFVVVPRRWAVGRTFGWLLRNRRLSKDYEELPEATEAWCYAAMTRLLLRRPTDQSA
jgi:putative transposase